jgi:hypothetical protein
VPKSRGLQAEGSPVRLSTRATPRGWFLPRSSVLTASSGTVRKSWRHSLRHWRAIEPAAEILRSD